MTDSLKERLRSWRPSFFDLDGPPKTQDDLTALWADMKCALARIEELEQDVFVLRAFRDQFFPRQMEAEATIAKLEADIKDYAYNIDQYRKENATLRGKLDRALEGLTEIGNADYPVGLRKRARSILSDTHGVPVAEPTVAGRKDEPSGEGESRLGNGLSPQADAGEEPEGDLKAAREANSAISRQRETIGKLRRALVTCHAELVAEVQIHYEKLANPDPKYRYEASMGAILKARSILSDLDVAGSASRHASLNCEPSGDSRFPNGLKPQPAIGDVEKLIERLEQGIDSVFDPDKGIPEAEAVMDEAAAMLRSLAAEKAKVEEERNELRMACNTNIAAIGHRNDDIKALRAKLEKAKDALKGYVDFNTEAERLIGLDDCDALARATLEEIK